MSGFAASSTDEPPVPRDVPASAERTGKEIGIVDLGQAGVTSKKDFQSEDSIVRRSPGSFPATDQPR
jgi:hypothetical protein